MGRVQKIMKNVVRYHVTRINLVLGSCSSKILLKGVYTGGVLSRLVANFCFSLNLLFAVMF